MTNTACQAFGWVLCMLAWGATIAMLLSEKWRVSALKGDMGSALDIQGRHEGLWSTCNKFPSGETHCTMLAIEISDVATVVVGSRALTILSVLFGAVGGVIILFAFKCTAHGPQDIEQKTLLGRYGGAMFLLCGICVTAAGAWYIVDIIGTIAFPDPKGNPIKWSSGEGVQVTLAAGILWIIGAVIVMLGSRHHRDVMLYEQKKPLHQEYV